MPLELGRWKKLESGAWGVEWTNGMKAQDVVIKVCSTTHRAARPALLASHRSPPTPPDPAVDDPGRHRTAPGVRRIQLLAPLLVSLLAPLQVPDESNGIGDAFLLYGEGEGMVDGPDAVNTFMHADPVYAGKEALVRPPALRLPTSEA